MKRLALLFGLLVASPASAGTLTFQVTDATDGTLTKAYNSFLDSDITRWIAANQSACNASLNLTCTRPQVLNYIITNFVAGQVVAVKQFETQAAQATAAAGVTPINPQ